MELYARPNVNLVDVVFDVYDSGPSIKAPEHVYRQKQGIGPDIYVRSTKT